MKQVTIHVSALALTIAAAAQALQPLSEVAEIREGLITAGIVLELDEVCDDVDLRSLRGLLFLNGLESRARDLGYSDTQIETYLEDDDEKDELVAIARARLTAMGAEAGDEDSHCAVARSEIAADTAIGRLLR